MTRLLTTTILLLSVLPSVGTAQIFGPSNFEDCIIEGMQGVASDVAAAAVARACREKFPVPPTPPEPTGSPLRFNYKAAREEGFTHQQIVQFFTTQWSISELQNALKLVQADPSLTSPDHRSAIVGAIEKINAKL